MAVTNGLNIMELITRAKTHLSVILWDNGYGNYATIKEYFEQAADQGLVEMVQLTEEAVDDDSTENEEEIGEDVDEQMGEKFSCMPGCCTS